MLGDLIVNLDRINKNLEIIGKNGKLTITARRRVCARSEKKS